MTTTDPFTAPSTPGTGIDFKELNGSLLLIDVQAFETGVPTTYGPSDAIRANVTVLDGPHKGDEHDDILIFPRVLRSQLKPAVGKPAVLARLGQGTAKPGQSPPWMLSAPTEADTTIARAYLAYKAGQTPVSQPAPATDKW